MLVTNVIGQQVMKIDQSNQAIGAHTLTIDLSGKPDGIYCISLVIDGKTVSKAKAIKTH